MFMTTNSSGFFSLSKSTNIAGVCKSNVKVISKILNCNLTKLQYWLYSGAKFFVSLIWFRLGEGENLAEIKYLQNMNTSISRIS